MIVSVIAVVLFLAVVTLLAIDRSWSNVTQEERNQIVFESKNKSYGAFKIRREYNRIVIIALGATLAVALVLTAGPVFLKFGDEAEQEKVVSMDNVKLVEPPPTKDETPPPPPPPPPPPTIKQIQFTEPEVTTEEVEEIPPAQTELTTKIGTENTEGEDVGVTPIENTGNGIEEVDNTLYSYVGEPPSFPGGEPALNAYLKSNINYPEQEKDAGVQGKVYLSFTVEKDGSIVNVTQVKGVSGGPGLTKEALRVVRGMPAWKPGKNNGKTVRCTFTIPINFTIR